MVNYVPPENWSFEQLRRGGWENTLARRRIRKKVGFEKFNDKDFAAEADDIFERAHIALMQRDKKELLKYATENAYQVCILFCYVLVQGGCRVVIAFYIEDFALSKFDYDVLITLVKAFYHSEEIYN